MSQIQKFSFLYDAAEDRLACDMESADASTSRLWLTQRFCRGLVGAIVAMLEKSQSEADGGRQVMLQSWQQAAAMGEFGKTPAVQPTPQSVTGLVSAAHLTPKERDVTIRFDFGDGDSRSVGLAYPEVRQMLGALHRVHVAAGWPLDFWPAWVADPTIAAAPTQTVN